MVFENGQKSEYDTKGFGIGKQEKKRIKNDDEVLD